MTLKHIVLLLKPIITKLKSKRDLIGIRMLADITADYVPSHNKPFMNKDNAAKQKTMSDVSGASNVVGMYSSSEMEEKLERNIMIRGKGDR